MTDLDLVAARRLADAATPGPWQIYRYKNGGGRIYIEEPQRKLIVDTEGDPDAIATAYHEPDREFLLAARSLVPTLLDQLEAAQQRIDRVIAFRNDALDTSQSPWLGKEIVSALDEALALGAAVNDSSTEAEL